MARTNVCLGAGEVSVATEGPESSNGTESDSDEAVPFTRNHLACGTATSGAPKPSYCRLGISQRVGRNKALEGSGGSWGLFLCLKSPVLYLICGYSLVVGRDLPKVEARVRFSLPAQIKKTALFCIVGRSLVGRVEAVIQSSRQCHDGGHDPYEKGEGYFL